jgi:Tfp pilus assembly protein PilV
MHRKLKIINKKSKIRNKFTGFTLTEVIMASALLIIVMVPILKALTIAHVSASIIEHRTNSLIYAQSKLDEIRARSIQDFGWLLSFTELNGSLDGRYLCNVLDLPASLNLKKITVSVGYDSNNNSILETDEIEVTLVTLIARR